MNIILDNRIRFLAASVPKSTLRLIKIEFTYKNPEFFKLRSMGYYTGGTPQEIATWRLEQDARWFTLPRGALRRFLDLISDIDTSPTIDDRRFAGSFVEYEWVSEGWTWRDYQIEAIDQIVENETCLIQGGPASGKSEILLGAIVRTGLKAGIIVHDKNLFSQWVRRIGKRLGIMERDVGKVGGGKFKIGEQITVIMQQTAKNKIDLLWNQFGFIGQDECHRASAPTFLEVMDAFNARFKVGMSATIKRQDLKQFLTHDQFGEIVFSIDRQELVDRGFTTDIELIIVMSEFYFDYINEDALNGLHEQGVIDLADMNAREKQALVKELQWEVSGYPQYLTAVAKDGKRNNLIYRCVKKEYDKGSSIILFTKRRKHCEEWKDTLAKVGIEVAIFWGSKSKKEDERIKEDIQRLKDGKVRIAIGNVLDEGLDLPAVDVGIITFRNAKNPGQLEQQAGRLARLFKGKKMARLYYIHDAKITRFKGDITGLRKRFKNVIVMNTNKKVKRIVKR